MIIKRGLKCDRCGKIDDSIRSYGTYGEYLLCDKCAREWDKYFDEHLEVYDKMLQEGKITMKEWDRLWYKYFRKFINEKRNEVKLVFT